MATATFIVRDTFQFGSSRRSGTVLTVPEEVVKAEIALGKHEKTKKPISGLLNHCSPADDATEAMLADFTGAKKPEQETKEESAVIRKNLMAEFDALGVPYDRRWSNERLEMELKKAKHMRASE